MGGITATTAIECAAGVSSATGDVASVECVLPASIVGAATAPPRLSLLALVLLLAALCSMSLIGLLWVLWHACRGLVAKCVAKHLDLPLHGID